MVEIKWAELGWKGKEVERNVRAKWSNGEGGLRKVLDGDIRMDQEKEGRGRNGDI